MYPGASTPTASNRSIQVPSLMDDGEIHILPVQTNRLAQAHSCNRQQTEEGRERTPAESLAR